VGGTWFWNRYPGCRCDVESIDYSYSFDPDLEQEWDWTERYATQPEILAYLDHVADRFDLRRDIRFDTRVEAAHFDEAAGRWSLRTDDGQTISAQWCVMATAACRPPTPPTTPASTTMPATRTTRPDGPTRGSTSPASGWRSSGRGRRPSRPSP